MIASIRAKAKELLHSGTVSCFIGYEEGTRGRVRPALVYTPEDAERLVWDERCTHDLVVYLHEFKLPASRGKEPPRVGLLVKPCDARALNTLVQEKQIDRKRLYVVGVRCAGVKANGELQERCLRCTQRVPLGCDMLVGEQPEAVATVDDAAVTHMEELSPAQRLSFWLREFDRCIRCYACRQACPACYCLECVAEQLDPPWMGIAIDVPQKQFFHVMRAYHLAGRCADCAACETACPMGIPLSLLNRKIAKEVEALFGYRAGQDAETPPPLATFKAEEMVLP